MKTKRMKKLLYYSTSFIIFISILCCSFDFFKNQYTLKQYNEVNENIKPVETEDISNTSSTSTLITNNQSNTTPIKTLDDYRSEYNNPDIVGKISIPNTNFSIVLVQTTNNSYYLNHLVNKQYNKLGATFVDYRNDLNNDQKINIYGHNNGKNSISFNHLMKYLNKSYYDKYNLIQIETDTSVKTYQIFSIQIVSNNNHMQISFTNDEWHTYLSNITATSIYDTNTNVNDIKEMITLQTCTNTKDYEFLLIHGRKIEK